MYRSAPLPHFAPRGEDASDRLRLSDSTLQPPHKCESSDVLASSSRAAASSAIPMKGDDRSAGRSFSGEILADQLPQVRADLMQRSGSQRTPAPTPRAGHRAPFEPEKHGSRDRSSSTNLHSHESAGAELQGYLFMRRRGRDGSLKRWRPRWLIAVSASQHESIEPSTRSIAYFDSVDAATADVPARAGAGRVQPRGFVVLGEDTRVSVPTEREFLCELCPTLGDGLRALPRERFVLLSSRHGHQWDLLAPTRELAARWAAGLSTIVEQLSRAGRCRLLSTDETAALPRDEQQRLVIERSHAVMARTTMLAQLVRGGMLELVCTKNSESPRGLRSSSARRAAPVPPGSSDSSYSPRPVSPMSEDDSPRAHENGEDEDDDEADAIAMADHYKAASTVDLLFTTTAASGAHLRASEVGRPVASLRDHCRKLFAPAIIDTEADDDDDDEGEYEDDADAYASGDDGGGGGGLRRQLSMDAVQSPPRTAARRVPPRTTAVLGHGQCTPSGFDLEYEHIQSVSMCYHSYADFSAATLAENMGKNRYFDVLPPDDTRCVLHTSVGQARDYDYINANFVDGVWDGADAERAFIAAQGPTDETAEAFWRLIVEQGVDVVVMLTRQLERGTLKCATYWPDGAAGDEATFGDVTVLLAERTDGDELIHRCLEVRVAGEERARLLHHFQYVAWPDHGLPASTAGFVELYKRVQGLRAERIRSGGANGAPPVLLHCSAGIGRTGTMLVVYSVATQYMQQLVNADERRDTVPLVSVVDTVLQLRRQRPGLVQTKEQYMFCYIAIEQLVDEMLHDAAGKCPYESPCRELENMLRRAVTDDAAKRRQAAAAQSRVSDSVAAARGSLRSSSPAVTQPSQRPKTRCASPFMTRFVEGGGEPFSFSAFTTSTCEALQSGVDSLLKAPLQRLSDKVDSLLDNRECPITFGKRKWRSSTVSSIDSSSAPSASAVALADASSLEESSADERDELRSEFSVQQPKNGKTRRRVKKKEESPPSQSSATSSSSTSVDAHSRRQRRKSDNLPGDELQQSMKKMQLESSAPERMQT